MAILRKKNRDKYTVIDNTVFFDYSLSFKAKGLLCQMLSLPDGWEFSIEGLTQFSTDGITLVRNTLMELEEHNYLKRIQIRSADGKMAGVEYEVSEIPMSVEPISENPISEEVTLLNTNISNTKELNTNNKTTNKRFTPPTVENVQEYIDENGYSIDAEHFVDYYTANGWMVGKSHMKDWRAAVRNWERNNGNDFGSSDRVRSRISETAGRSKRDAEVHRHKPLPLAADIFGPQRSEDDA